MICDHCGLNLLGYGSVSFGGTIVKLCHTRAIGRPDCYRRVTVYHEPLGVLKNINHVPEGVEHIRDPGLVAAREILEFGQQYPTENTVCVTHKRFVPCRRSDGFCVFSSTPEDVENVRGYQQDT